MNSNRAACASATILLVVALLPSAWPLAGALADVRAWHELINARARLQQLMATTGVIAGGVLFFAAPLGVATAVSIFRLRATGQALAATLLGAAAFVPMVAHAGGWQAIIGPHGIVSIGSDVESAGQRCGAVIVIHSMFAIPWICGLVGVGLLCVAPLLEDQARLDASDAAVLMRVTLPASRVAIALASLFAVAPVLTDPSVTDLYLVRSFAEEVYTEIEEGGDARATTLAMLPIIATTTGLLAWLVARFFSAQSRIAMPRRWRLDRSTWLFAATAWVVLGMLLLPIAGLVRQLGLTTAYAALPSLVEPRWSFGVGVDYLSREMFHSLAAITIDLARGLATSVLVTAAAMWCVYQFRATGGRTRIAGIFAVTWMVMVSGPIVGLGCVDLLNRPSPFGLLGWVYDSELALAFGRAVRIAPFCAALVAAGFAWLDPDLIDAARLEGARMRQLLVSIIAPLLVPTLAVSILLGAALAFAELPVTKLIAPPGADPAVLVLFSLLHTGTANQQAAFCLWVLMATGGLLVVGGAAMRFRGSWTLQSDPNAVF